jgi:tRNA modification GTPase
MPLSGSAPRVAVPTDTWVDDTIAAISTPLGQGALAVIRLSGARSLAIADAVFRPAGHDAPLPSKAPSHTVHYGKIVQDGSTVDEVLLTVLRRPRTFTREDMVEFGCHGGVVVARMVLDTILRAGARLALPGEFTKRAFIHGRIDLAQAEAVMDLIHAQTELALAAAHEQLAGKLSQRINTLRDELLQTLAHLEAHIDFPDEDIAPDTFERLQDRLERAVGLMDQLLRTAHEGQVLRRGIRAAIVGRPNVGKSSLLNQLLGHERAIVSPIPGTTRDTIEETANIRGLPIIFVDTAGLRDSNDTLEREGVRRSQQALSKAELVLQVFDNSEPLHSDDDLGLCGSGDAQASELWPVRPRIVVRNKTDLPPRLELPAKLGCRTVDVSCQTGYGIETLKDAICEAIWGGEIRSDMVQVMINSRHQEALQRGRDAAILAFESLRSGATLELVAVDLRMAVNAVGEIVGKTSTEDLLDSVFSQFCIGK